MPNLPSVTFFGHKRCSLSLNLTKIDIELVKNSPSEGVGEAVGEVEKVVSPHLHLLRGAIGLADDVHTASGLLELLTTQVIALANGCFTIGGCVVNRFDTISAACVVFPQL